MTYICALTKNHSLYNISRDMPCSRWSVRVEKEGGEIGHHWDVHQ